MQRELAFFDKVKARLRSREAYADFLKCLNLFAEDVLSKSELVSLVHDMLGKQSDLMVRTLRYAALCGAVLCGAGTRSVRAVLGCWGQSEGTGLQQSKSPVCRLGSQACRRWLAQVEPVRQPNAAVNLRCCSPVQRGCS